MKAKSNMRKKQKSRKPAPKPIADLVHVDLPFFIPQDFLRALQEFSAGGYVLITIGSNGNPQVHAQFDNSMIALGFQKFGTDYFAKFGEQIQINLNTMDRGNDGGHEEEGFSGLDG